MFSKDHGSFGPPSSNDETYRDTISLLELAGEAFSRNDYAQAAHLYLAAFAASEQIGSGAYQPAIDGLRQAWQAACELKDRALAEHVFEKLEPFSNSEEVAMHAEALQRLALDKLEEFGFSREDLQDMADMVSEDFARTLSDAPGPESVVAQVLSIDTAEQKASRGVFSWPLLKPGKPDAAPDAELAEPKNPEEYTYADLVGFDQAIAAMKKRGIGMRNDEQFIEFMAALAQRHGIDTLPSFETLLFRSPSRADMNQFMMATAQELAAPSVRMYMEETPMGFPVLCVMTTSDVKMNPARGGFVGPGVLILEDIDTWGTPFSSSMDESEGMPYYAQLSRGARDAIMFIRSAVENADVQVMATCSSDAELDEFFYELLGPLDVFDIDLPTEDERRQVWEDVYALYPSMRVLQSSDIVRLSANLSRFDIYMAAREAVDQAFKTSIAQRSYIPVTRDNLYNKLAAYQPLDSSEYHELEEQAVESLREDLDKVDDLLKGTE